MTTTMGKLLIFVMAVAVVSRAVADHTTDDYQDSGNSRCPESFEGFKQSVINYSSRLLNSLIQTPASDDTYIASPLVALAKVAQIAYFAEGATLAEALELVGFTNKDDIPCVLKEAIHPFLNTPEGVNYLFSSNIVADNSYKFQETFINEVYANIKINAKNYNFREPNKQRRRINKMVASETDGEVLNIVKSSSQINIRTEFSIFVGQYFESEYDVAFNKNNITIGKYYKRPNTVIKTNYLYQRGVFDYYYSENLKAKIVRIPFKYDSLEEILIVPDKDYKSVARKLASDGCLFQEVYDSLKPAVLSLYLPAYLNISKTIDSRDLLMKNSFMKTIYYSETAQLKNVTVGDKPVGLEQFIQKIVLKNSLQGGQQPDDCGCSDGLVDMKEYEVIADRPVLRFIGSQGMPLFCLVGKVGKV